MNDVLIVINQYNDRINDLLKYFRVEHESAHYFLRVMVAHFYWRNYHASLIDPLSSQLCEG